MAWKIAVRFERGGVSFQYPENWQILPEPYDLGWSVTVQSPGTAFLTLTCDESNPGIGELADAALSAIKDEFKQLDVSPFSGTVAGLPAIGHEKSTSGSGGIRLMSFISSMIKTGMTLSLPMSL